VNCHYQESKEGVKGDVYICTLSVQEMVVLFSGFEKTGEEACLEDYWNQELCLECPCDDHMSVQWK
jgi:hypothetical protein